MSQTLKQNQTQTRPQQTDAKDVGQLTTGRAGKRRNSQSKARKPRPADLTPQELDEVRVLLSQALDYKDDAALHEPDAEKTLFDDAAAPPEPATDWFMSVMERGENASELRGNVSSLLDAEQERTLFLRFNYARMRVKQLQEELNAGSGTDAAKARQMLQWSRIANDLRDLLAKFNLGLVVAMAKRSRARNLDFSEQVSEGSMALLNAIDKFNPALGYKFSTYACKLILNALNHAGIKQSRHRGMFATGFEISSDQAANGEDPSELAMDDHSKQIGSILQGNEAKLTDLEQEVIRHRFPMPATGQGNDSEPLTLAEVGKMVGLTKEGVRRVQLKALKKIRTVIQGDYAELNDQYSVI
jgi:RNA polymerase sigma factor (sigma-70 family)